LEFMKKRRQQRIKKTNDFMYMESVSLFQSINPIVSLSNNRKETEKKKKKRERKA